MKVFVIKPETGGGIIIQPMPPDLENDLKHYAQLGKVKNGRYRHPEFGNLYFVAMGRGKHKCAVRLAELPLKIRKKASMAIDVLFGTIGH